MRLSSLNGQIMRRDSDDLIYITATVNDTWQLRWWLLGQADNVEVCMPLHLREEISSKLLNAYRRYK